MRREALHKPRRTLVILLTSTLTLSSILPPIALHTHTTKMSVRPLFTLLSLFALVFLAEALSAARTSSDLTKTSGRQDGGTEVSITASGDDGTPSSASAFGSEIHVISDTEIATFGLGEVSLKQAVGAYKGREPNDAFLRSPTPWDDLYTTYDWQQVTTTIQPVSAEVIEKTIEPVIVSTTPFNNTSSQTATFDVSARQEVRNTVTSSWEQSGSVTFGQTIKYEVKFEGIGVGGSTSLSFESGWGEGGSEAQTIVVGLSSGVQVELEPGEYVFSTIRASRGTMKVKVAYRATLSGYVACNYNPTFEDHHFWAYGVNSVLAAAERSTEVIVEEVLDVGFYFNSYVETSDVQHTG